MRLKKLVFGLLPALGLLIAVEGTARIVWWRLERQASRTTRKQGEDLLAATKFINFFLVPDGDYVYVLKRNYDCNGYVVNSQGFAQREEVPLERVPGKLRLMALGESTTQGQDIDRANYPIYLRHLLANRAPGPDGVEIINAGISGWISDQLALRSERELAAYRPDILMLYTGWNDFSSYDPLDAPPTESRFRPEFGGVFARQAGTYFKSVALASAWYQKRRAEWVNRERADHPLAAVSPADTYRIFLNNLERIVTAFRSANPRITICLCTLVGRWPCMTTAEFEPLDSGRVLWMRKHGLTPDQAAARLGDFNFLLRTFAAEHQLVLIDAATPFEPLDRHSLQYDYCHLHPEGYELLAEVMYEGMRQAGVVTGQPSPRRDELLAKYRRTQ
jgi:lysophospholipase L1-like esterase